MFSQAAEEGEVPEDEIQKSKKSKSGEQFNALRCDLNNVEGHEAFTYEFLLTRVADHINTITGGSSDAAGAFKLIEP
mgnify:CR=1 FL=1